MLPYIIILLIIAIAAIIIVYLLKQQKSLVSDKAEQDAINQQLLVQKQSLEGEKLKLESDNMSLKAQLDAQKTIFEAKEQQQREAQDKLDAERMRAQAKLEAERAEAQTKLEQERFETFASMKKQMEDSFKLLSSQSSKELREQNSNSITELLKPVNDKFELFDKLVRDSQAQSAAQDASLRELLKTMMDQSKSVGDEAKNLANALLGHSKMQGDFGEMLLVDLLKNSGLKEGVHFVKQSVIRDSDGHEVKSDEGATMIPDVIVYYPDDTEVIIDSKVSLSAYAQYYNAQSLEERSKWSKEHIRSVTKHIEELRTKDYASYIDESHKKVDYNIMFIPVEGAFRLMLEEEPLLWQKAKDANVLIVSQMNLMILLNMILLSWKRYDQERNIQEVYATTSELMSQLRGWLDQFSKIGASIQSASDSFQEAKRKLQDSKQSVFKKIEKLERLNLSPKRSSARLKVSSRSSTGFESIIPASLVDTGLPNANSDDNLPAAAEAIDDFPKAE